MTEAEWLTCPDPAKLLDRLKTSGPVRARKLRLFAACCARRVGHLLTEGDEVGQRALAEAEEMAEGRAEPATVVGFQEHVRAQAATAEGARRNALGAVYNTLQVAGTEYSRPSRAGYPRLGVDWPYKPPDLMAADWYATWAVYQSADDPSDWFTSAVVRVEHDHQAAALRDIFGNPFLPVAFSSSWRTSTAVSLASQMYESRDFSAMPILADALQDAGCNNDDILSHCRGEGPHVRGCWVVDLVLGKE